MFLEHLFREMTKIDYYSRDNIIIVTHDLFIRLFLLNFLGLDVSLINAIKKPGNCEFILIEKEKDGNYEIKSEIYNKEETKKLTLKNSGNKRSVLPKLDDLSLTKKSNSFMPTANAKKIAEQLTANIGKDVDVELNKTRKMNDVSDIEEDVYAEDDSDD